MIVKEIKKSRHARSKLPIIMQRLKIDLCCKFGISRVNRNNKKLDFSSCLTQQNIPMLIYCNKKHCKQNISLNKERLDFR